MAKILVTGINGFVGRHLLNELTSRGQQVVGVDHSAAAPNKVTDLLTSYHACDLTDPAQVQTLPLENIDVVINLAGLANVGESFNEAERYKHVNVAVLTVLGERLLETGSNARVIGVSSGTIYSPDQPMPLSEASRLMDAGSPYAQSKVLMEEGGRILAQKGLDYITVRPFNHIGPGQGPGLLIPDLYSKLKAASESNHTISVGNLRTRRDYSDVRDIVRAYADLALAQDLEYDLYNVCRGQSKSGQEILDIFLKEMDLVGKIKTEVNPNFIRPNDPPDLYGSYARLYAQTAWEPTIQIEQTIKDFIDSDRA